MEAKIEQVLERLERVEAALRAPPRGYLNTKEAASFTGISTVQMEEWRSRGGGPAYHKVGRKVLYSLEDLRAFVASNRVEAMQ